jgi:hypothetical protein
LASRNATFHDETLIGVLLGPLKLILGLAAGLVVLLVCAWIVDGVFVFKIWPQGIERLRELLADDLARGVALAARQGADASVITAPANALYWLVFEVSGIDDIGRQFAGDASLSIPDTVLRRAYFTHRAAIEVAMVGTQLLGVRAAILVRFVSLLALLYVVGAADGVSRRAIRRAGGGRESASLYHRAKYLQLTVLGLGGVALLMWPGTVAWGVWVGLLAMLIGCLVGVQWAYYKKHL